MEGKEMAEHLGFTILDVTILTQMKYIFLYAVGLDIL